MQWAQCHSSYWEAVWGERGGVRLAALNHLPQLGASHWMRNSSSSSWDDEEEAEEVDAMAMEAAIMVWDGESERSYIVETCSSDLIVPECSSVHAVEESSSMLVGRL